MLSGKEIIEKKMGSATIHPNTTSVKMSRPMPNFLVPTISILFIAKKNRPIKIENEYTGAARKLIASLIICFPYLP
jgi:hypothetical protein